MLHISLRSLRLLIALAIIFLSAGNLFADGLIIVHNPPHVPHGHFAFAPLEVRYHNVEVTIENNIATTKVDQEFYNPNPQQLEGTYIFPLPEGATIDKFAIDVNGKMTEAELLSADKARQIYEDIVRKMRDPALLEYVGKGAFKARIFPIEGNGRKQVKLVYTQILKPDMQLCEYTYSLNTEKFSAKLLENVSIKIDLKSEEPLRNIYSPSHNIDVHYDGDRHAVISYSDRNARPDTDFKLIWSRQNKQLVGLTTLSYKSPGSEYGYFLVMASPGAGPSKELIQNRNVIFVIDTSGSMAGAKMEQARKALRFCLANLNDGDTFNVVRFSTDVEPLFSSPVEAKKENIDRAQDFVDKMKPIGGTAIGEALNEALGQKRAEKKLPGVVIFLTDGQPTIGETSEDKLVAAINSSESRIFSFGIGTDINTHLLDRISGSTKAFSQYVLPNEDIEVKVSNFYTKIKSPVCSNIRMSVISPADLATGKQLSDVRVDQTYPRELPELYRGDTLIALGRYKGNGEATVKIDGDNCAFASVHDFTRDNTKYAFIPRLWATRRVGWLLDEIRMRGESKELKDEIVSLAREHGIVTPYTSYLIVEDEAKRAVPMAMRTQSEFGQDVAANTRAKEWYDSSRRDSDKLERGGERAVLNSAAVEQLKQSINGSQTVQNGTVLSKSAAGPMGGGSGYRATTNYAQQARNINGRSFYQNGNIWVDATAQNQKSLRNRQVAFNSDDYFKLLADHADIAPWLSLGDQVDIVIGDELISIR